MAVARAWPSKLASIQSQERGDVSRAGGGLNTSLVRAAGLSPPGAGRRAPVTGDSRRTLRTAEVWRV